MCSLYTPLYFVIQWQQKKQQTNKQEAETRYKYSQIKSFSSPLAKPETAPQIELRLSMNFVKHFCLRHTVKLDTSIQQSLGIRQQNSWISGPAYGFFSFQFSFKFQLSLFRSFQFSWSQASISPITVCLWIFFNFSHDSTSISVSVISFSFKTFSVLLSLCAALNGSVF